MSDDKKQARRPPLTRLDLQYMNIPEALWRKDRCSLSGVPDSVSREVRSYVAKLGDAIQSGTGLLLSGSRGVGKSAIAAIVCKAAKMHRKSCFFVPIWELREMLRAHIQFDADTSIMSRCREVDVLVLDDLREEDAVASGYLSLRDLEGLLATRASQNKVTVITTRLEPLEMKEKMPGIAETTLSHLLPLRVQGPDKRAAGMQRVREHLFGERD